MSTPTTAPLDFAQLASEDRYARYFNQMTLAFNMLLKAFRLELSETGSENYELNIIPEYLQKLLNTIGLLRLKYTYRGTHSRSLYIDLTDSGFPNYSEIAVLTQDLLTRKEALQQFMPASLLKRQMLDHMLSQGTEPEELLASMSQRAYREQLDENKVFLPFVPGRLIARAQDKQYRSYIFSWGCYDFSTNQPYVYIMVFDHNVKRPPLEDKGANYHDFIDHIRTEGSRVPDVGFLAAQLDNITDHIHPKMIKRLRLGPFYSRVLLEDSEKLGPLDAEAAVALKLLSTAVNPDDFICHYGSETVVSKRQEKVDSRILFGPVKKVREVFLIPDGDLECIKRKASAIHNDVLMPHTVAQHVTDEFIAQQAPELSGVRIVSYDQKGHIYV